MCVYVNKYADTHGGERKVSDPLSCNCNSTTGRKGKFQEITCGLSDLESQNM